MHLPFPSARGFIRESLIVAAAAMLCLRGSSGRAAEPQSAPPAGASPAASFDSRTFFAKHCIECHGEKKAKSDLRLDQLSADFAGEASRKTWRTVLEKISAGEMPPDSKPRPPKRELHDLSAWIATNVRAADQKQRLAEGRAVLRRLNRVEYENTVRDLLGIDADLKELLPLDTSADGFDNIGDALHTSSFLMEKYLEAADTALNFAIANYPQPKSVLKRYSPQDAHQVRSTTEKVFRKLDGGGVVMFTSSPWQKITPQFYPQERGRYRFRMSVSATQSKGKPVTFAVWAGDGGMGGVKGHLVSYFDAPADKPAVIEFFDRVEPKTSMSFLPYGLTSSQTVSKVGAQEWDGPGLQVDWVEVEGPINETWPPESHKRIFGDLPQGSAPIYNHKDRLEVTSKDPQADAERVIRNFARRAYRRPAGDAELKPILALVQSRLKDGYSFEKSVRVGLTAVMTSPPFLFLQEKPGPLDDYALASRLSYFLWSSMPDEELLSLAERGELTGRKDKETGRQGDREKDKGTTSFSLSPSLPLSLSASPALRAQVDRMLRDPKATAFTKNFTGQWLGLRDIDFTIPSHILYPDYDDMLKASMVREAELFFTQVLQENLSISNFIASDFTMLNGRLAKHYGIAGVDGWAFQKVKLPPDSHRGGVLTMAAVLKVTANGTSTSPVIRGAWVLRNILGTPPAPPPENVGSIEPDTRGATTIREQLAKHRQIESCASCHVKIDPPGFALESFDVIGGYREFYRCSGNGKPVTIDGKKMPYLHGKKVDPSDKLADGTAFSNIDEFKQLLLKDKDRFARALTTKLMTYATGAPVDVTDRPQIDEILTRAKEKDYAFRDLIQEMVQSELFRTK
jgi:mono/diheme cytochrome c family protein